MGARRFRFTAMGVLAGVALEILVGVPRALAEPLGDLGDRVDDPKIVRRVRQGRGALAPVAEGPRSSVTPAQTPGGMTSAGTPAVGASALAPSPAEPPSTGGTSARVVPVAPAAPSSLPSARGAPSPEASATPRGSPAPSVVAATPRTSLVAPTAPVPEAPREPLPPAALGAPSADLAVSERASPREEPWPYAPRLELTWRHLPLFRVGAQENGDPTGKVANEGFQVLSGRVFPTSSLFRFGLGADFGWESGHFATGGDYFLTESTSLGIQRVGRVTPFFDATAGGGYLRRLQVGVTVPSAIWFFGGEAGIDLYALDRLYVHLSVGRMRVVNGLAQLSAFARVFEDVWFLRVGLGL